jgi:putative hydrolase of the HAD superfamily
VEGSRLLNAVFFDAVGTLIHADPPATEVYLKIGRRWGSRLTRAEVAARFAQAFAAEESADHALGLCTSEERERARWQRIVASVLDDVSDREGCFRELYEHFRRPAAWRIEPDLTALCRELEQRGLILGLDSNYDHRLRDVIAGVPGLRSFRHIVISSEVGWRKPAQKFFVALAAGAGVEPQTILHVGDDPENDYEGALAAGVHAVLFDPANRYPSFLGKRVQRLADLPAWLGSQFPR